MWFNTNTPIYVCDLLKQNLVVYTFVSHTSKSMNKIDDSFKKPGAVPFKWEIRPGVPKIQNPQPPLDDRHFRKQPHQREHQYSSVSNHQEDSPTLKPPPAQYSLQSPLHASSRRSGLWGLAQPNVVPSTGCFPSPMAKRKDVKKRMGEPRPRSEPDYNSDLDTPSTWSVSSRKSVSPLSSSSFASSQSSPRPCSDADWAAFGLF